MAPKITVTVRIDEEEFVLDDGIYKWTWIYIGDKLRFSMYFKL